MFLRGFPLREFTAFKCNGYSSNTFRTNYGYSSIGNTWINYGMSYMMLGCMRSVNSRRELVSTQFQSRTNMEKGHLVRKLGNDINTEFAQ